MRINRNYVPVIYSLLALSCLYVVALNATEEYARDSGKNCIACHENSAGGGKLNLDGQFYLNRILREDAIGPAKSMYQPWLRISIGFLHMLAGVFWIGSMLYILLLAKTPYALRGPVKNEIRYVLITIILIGLTGTYLMFQRYPAFENLVDFWSSRLLILKIGLYLLMIVLSAILYGFIIPHLRKKAAPAADRHIGKAITIKDLRLFDGRYNRPAYIGYMGKIYNVTPSRYWSNGEHFFRHYAGQDLTSFLKDAPHGEENILHMTLVGEIMEKQKINAHWVASLAFYTARLVQPAVRFGHTFY